MSGFTIKLQRGKVRVGTKAGTETPVGRCRLMSSWWGRSEGNCCNQHCLMLAAMKTTENLLKTRFNTAHLAFPPTPLMFMYSSWSLEED